MGIQEDLNAASLLLQIMHCIEDVWQARMRLDRGANSRSGGGNVTFLGNK